MTKLRGGTIEAISGYMDEDRTTAAVQRYLGELAHLDGDAPAEPVIRALIDRSVRRLHLLSHALLVRSYPRLMRPPLNLQAEEMLSALVDRLLKALHDVRPGNVRQFFALVNRHMRWELNDLARQLDRQTPVVDVQEVAVAAPQSNDSALSPNALRMLDAIEQLPAEEREIFELVRIQGMSHVEAANILGISTKTVQRRLNRGVMMLSKALSDLRPSPSLPD